MLWSGLTLPALPQALLDGRVGRSPGLGWGTLLFPTTLFPHCRVAAGHITPVSETLCFRGTGRRIPKRCCIHVSPPQPAHAGMAGHSCPPVICFQPNLPSLTEKLPRGRCKTHTVSLPCSLEEERRIQESPDAADQDGERLPAVIRFLFSWSLRANIKQGIAVEQKSTQRYSAYDFAVSLAQANSPPQSTVSFSAVGLTDGVSSGN